MTYVLIFPIERTMEGVCARVDEFDFRIVDVYVCRDLEVRLSVDNSARRRLTGVQVVLPNFLAYPSTAIVIAATILFYTGIISLTYHNEMMFFYRFL